MSDVAAIYNVPSTQQELDAWSFSHAAHHRDINRVIFQTLGINLPEYVLDPFDIRNPGVWLEQHQQMHNNQDELLGIAGFDLVDVDLTDYNQLSGWIYLVAYEHKQAADILGIG